jgi:dsRNA-specific ribonuclease
MDPFENLDGQPSHASELPGHRQKLQTRLQKYQWQSTVNVDTQGPPGGQLFKVSLFIGSTMIGESEWFTDKDAAMENAAMQALAWLDTYGYH